MKKTLIAAAMALTAAACGGSSKKTPANSALACNIPADGSCLSAEGPTAALDAGGYTAAECTASGGQSVASCPTASRVGRCSFVDGQVTAVLHLYPPVTATDGQTVCQQSGGTWTAG